MQLIIDNLGKKYLHKWVFRNLNATLQPNHHIGILGKNGSGKSTLLKILAGMVQATEGRVQHLHKGKLVGETMYQYIAVASPHLELFMEFSLQESLELHQRFKPFIPQCDTRFILEYMGLEKNKNKSLHNFSSGMLQRVKLALAVFSDVPLVLLDEPCSNLDIHSIEWYKNLISTYMKDRLLIVASNSREQECHSCQHFFEFSQQSINFR